MNKHVRHYNCTSVLFILGDCEVVQGCFTEGSDSLISVFFGHLLQVKLQDTIRFLFAT